MGLTQLAAQLARQEHPRYYTSWLRYSRQISLDDEDISLSIWGGMHGYSGKGLFLHLLQNDLVTTDGLVFVYDITRHETWEDCKVMVQEALAACSLQHRVRQEAVRKRIMIMGNKCELVKEREVEFAAVKNYADENGLIVVHRDKCQGRHQCGLCFYQLYRSIARNTSKFSKMFIVILMVSCCVALVLKFKTLV